MSADSPRALRRWVRWAAMLLAAIALTGHLLYWYWPRARSATPIPGGVPAQILTDSRWPYRLWIPFPHQNLGQFERNAGDLEGLFSAVAQAAGRRSPAPRLPGFGPLRIPPAGELTIAADPEADRLLVAAKVYPSFAVLARIAGFLARNPWLSGGEVSLAGRKTRVRWEGATWIVGEELPRVAFGDLHGPFTAALALLATRGDPPYLPAGLYRLEKRGEGLAVVSRTGSTAAGALRRLLERPQAPALLAAEATSASPGSWRAQALWTGEGGRELLPSAAVFAAGASELGSLPGAELVRLTGRKLPSTEVAGVRIAALDRGTLTAAASFVPALTETIQGTGSRPLQVAVVLDVERAAPAASRLADALTALPLAGRRETLRWRGVAALLDALLPCGTVAAVVEGPPTDSAELLCGRVERPESPSKSLAKSGS